ncbi:MAG TPA: class I SAM-dependent methyltransferase [Pyrinomonadaceae bacterium]|jgi:ubiquinone/menaquinone biosynthesis C-methylase UbiE
MPKETKSYIPALNFHWLTRFYDPVVRWTTRENTFKEALMRQANLQNGQKILDLGCGTGTLGRKIKKQFPAAQVFALDADEKILQMARRKADRENVEITFEQGFSDNLPFADAAFERVVSTLFFHHLDNRSMRQTLLETLRVLKPKGELHIADFGAPSNVLERLFSHSSPSTDSAETTADNPEEPLPFLMSETGFVNVESGAYFKTIAGTIRLFKALKN